MFLYPLTLFGLISIGIPIGIHLLNKQNYDRVNWAAMRFVQIAREQTQRRVRFEDLLLLLVRCAMLALLVIALARPVFRLAGGMLGRGSVTAVIAVDNSYSMTGTDGVTSRFQNAKDAADRIISALPAGSSVSIVFASNLADAVIPDPTYDLNLARKTIRDAPLTDRSTDLLPAFRKALETLKKASGSKELYLITDGQRNGWARMPEIVQSLQEVHGQIDTRILLVGPDVRENAGLSDLRVAGDLTPVDRPFRFEATVTNFGSAVIHNLPVQLRIDTGNNNTAAAENQTIIDELPAGQSRVISLFGKLRSAGTHAVTASIPADHLTADDRRTIIVRGIDRAKILLVDGDSADTSDKTGAAFLRSALLPIPSSQIDNYFLQVKTISAADLLSAALGDYAAVITADLSTFDTKTADALADYVHHGGGLMVFPGADTTPEAYNKELVERLHLLPAALGAAHGDAKQQDQFFALQSDNFDHPIAAVWKDPVNGSPAAAHFFRAFTLEPLVGNAKSAQVILRYSDGAPAIMQSGQVILFSSTADTSWNDLADHGGVFVPLIYRSIASLLARGDDGLNIGVGVPFQQNLLIDDLGRTVTTTDPSGKKGDTTTSLQGESALLRVADTSLAGAYTAILAGDPPLTIRYAAQSDPNESRLESLTESDIASLSQAATVIQWTSGSDNTAETAARGDSDGWWVLLAALALAIAAAEPFMANRFGEAK